MSKLPVNPERSPSPYQFFTRQEWAELGSGIPLTLNTQDLIRLQGLNEPISLDEVADIYLPLVSLLSLYVASSQELFRDIHKFCGSKGQTKKPYIIGLAGSVAVGKSTMARILRLLLSQLPTHPSVDLVPTDGFLFNNAHLLAGGLMNRKGFPESYDIPALLGFLAGVKAGERHIRTPVYSHVSYDIVPDQFIEVNQPDILILEGLNLLQPGRLPRDGEAIPFVSDYLDFSIYLNAEEETIGQWYLERFIQLRETAFQDPKSYFHHYSLVNKKDIAKIGKDIWETINLVNLRENILPTRQRASLILSKDKNHRIDQIMLRNL